MFPCLIKFLFFKLLVWKNDRMTRNFTDKNIQRGLYVRFRTEIDWTGSNSPSDFELPTIFHALFHFRYNSYYQKLNHWNAILEL